MTHSHRRRRYAALLLAMALIAVGCGGGRSSNDSSNPTTTGGGSGSTGTTAATADTLIDASSCSNTTQGVTDADITFGISHPESGIAAPYAAIAEGARAYFNYVNAEKGGVQGHQIKLLAKDDAYDSGKTVTAVNELVQADGVFGFFNNVGTPNNLAVWDQLQAQCVPDLLAAATGAQALVDPVKHPFMLIGNPAYATEAAIFVQYLNQTKPDAKIAVLYQNDDFGLSYLGPLQKAIEGTSLTIADTQSYEVTDTTLDSQMTTLAASGADVVFLGVEGLKCPQGLDASAGKGFGIVYISGTCTASVLMDLAKPESSNGVVSTAYIEDPNDPQFANDPEMQLFKEKAPQYNDKADITNGLVAYGWTQAALLVAILDKAPALDRVSVMETAMDLSMDTPPGLLLDGVPWTTGGVDDGFPIETSYLVTYDSATKLFTLQGDPISYEGKTNDVLAGA